MKETTNKAFFSKENRPVLIGMGVILAAIIAGIVVVILAVNGVFRPTPSSGQMLPVTDANGSIVEWIDPDEPNWTEPIK